MKLTVVIVQLVPPHTHGVLSRWLIKVAPGVYTGTVSARVRDQLWAQLLPVIDEGRAILIYPEANEQGLAVRTYGAGRYEPIDFDGLTLVLQNPKLETSIEEFPVDW